MPYQDDLPFARGSETSRAAAESMKECAATQRNRVLEFIRSAHEVTDQEIQTALGMSPQTECPRRIELQRAGLIMPVGKRKTRSGRMAITWKAA